MLQSFFPVDIFGFISGIFILVFVIVIVFLIIVIIIVYKILHSNVDDVNRKSVKTPPDVFSQPQGFSVETTKETTKEKLGEEKEVNSCKYCGENIEENTAFCPYCGSNLTN
jgi:hypothetical protein